MAVPQGITSLGSFKRDVEHDVLTGDHMRTTATDLPMLAQTLILDDQPRSMTEDTGTTDPDLMAKDFDGGHTIPVGPELPDLFESPPFIPNDVSGSTMHIMPATGGPTPGDLPLTRPALPPVRRPLMHNKRLFPII